jgi:hypothetical protein
MAQSRTLQLVEFSPIATDFGRQPKLVPCRTVSSIHLHRVPEKPYVIAFLDIVVGLDHGDGSRCRSTRGP